MATNITSFIEEVRQSVPTCPNPIIKRGLIRSARWLCQESLLWRQTLTAMTSVDGTPDYTLTTLATEPSAEVVTIMFASYDNNPVIIKPEVWFDTYYKTIDWRTTETSQPRFAYLTADRGYIRFVKTPDTGADSIEVIVAVKPPHTATQLPDFLYNDWFDAIIYGALQYLFRLVEKPWFNQEFSDRYGFMFNREVNRGKLYVANGSMMSTTIDGVKF